MKVPAWVEGLMAERFFGECSVHENCRKNEKNIFCLNCCQSFCPHCLASHHPHHSLLQVRRYVYQDVIRLDDLEKLIDCSYIQAYTINRAKVIFLNQRVQSCSKSSKSSSCGNSCLTCDRILQDPFNFCSLSCKVNRVLYEGENMSGDLFRFDDSGFPISQLEGLKFVGALELEDPLDEIGGSEYRISNVSSCDLDGSGLVGKIPNKKKNGCFPDIMLSFSNRRKRAPHRSPLS